jgi:hypothetical protein
LPTLFVAGLILLVDPTAPLNNYSINYYDPETGTTVSSTNLSGNNLDEKLLVGINKIEIIPDGNISIC